MDEAGLNEMSEPVEVDAGWEVELCRAVRLFTRCLEGESVEELQCGRSNMAKIRGRKILMVVLCMNWREACGCQRGQRGRNCKCQAEIGRKVHCEDGEEKIRS